MNLRETEMSSDRSKSSQVPTFRVSLSLEEIEVIVDSLEAISENAALQGKLTLVLFKASSGLKSPDYVRTGARTSEVISVAKLAEIDEFDTEAYMAQLEKEQKDRK